MRFFTAAILIFLMAGAAQAGPALDKAQMGKTLACGYITYPPALMHNARIGAWTGHDAEFADLIAKRMEISIERKVETNWATVPEDLKTKKYDFLCSAYWVNPHKAKFVLFTKPLYYQPALLVVRADDTRFDGRPEKLNDPKIKIAALEGDNPVNIIKNDFPKAQTLLLPSAINKYSETLLSVADGKADAVIADASVFGLYNKNNPGKLKIANPDKPIRIYPAGFVVSGDDVQLWHAINSAIDELALDGSLERVMRKYIDYPHAYYPVARDGTYTVVSKVKK